LIGFLYYTLMEGSELHATIGKKMMGMQVVDETGSGIDYGKAAVRALTRYLSGMLFGIGYLIALFSENRQALHDKLAGTYVVDSENVPFGLADTSGAAIIGVTGEVAGMRFPLHGNGAMIGRDAISCQIVLHKSRGISRLHCFISYNPKSGMYILSDRNSKYGTFTGRGMRVTARKSIALKKGERFYLASKDAMFEVA
jgi:hypothetical protein